MSDVNQANLRDLLVLNYESLTQKLTSRLGSSDSAREALQDTYLRLEKAVPPTQIRSPQNYLFRIALNIAADRRRSEARRLKETEIDALMDLPDEAPDQCRVLEARSELQVLARALQELPQRRRSIFVAALVHEIPRRTIAKYYGVTVRTIDFEIQRALEHGARRLNEILEPTGFDSFRSESSKD